MVVIIAVLVVFKNFFYRIPVAAFQLQFVMIISLLKYLDNGDTPMLLQCVKGVQIRSCFWSVCSCIQFECREIRTRSKSVFGHFSRSTPDLTNS